MAGPVTTTIDPELCDGCGLCVRVCPSRTLSLVQGRALVSGTRSLGCGHCAAVCPRGAVRVAALEEEPLRFTTFETDERWLPHGRFDAGSLVRLMRSRRSCRNFQDRPVERAVLEDLARVGATAPSGTNCQLWTFTLLPDRAAILALAEEIGQFFRKTNKMAERAWLRKLLKLLGKPQLDWFYREYYQQVKDGLAEWERTGRDPLFHGAPAAILVGMRPGASCPAEDALIAAHQIVLAAQALGLGSCYVGLAVSAFQNEPALKDLVGLPRPEVVYAVLALGHPAESYQTVAGRKPVKIRYFEG